MSRFWHLYLLLLCMDAQVLVWNIEGPSCYNDLALMDAYKSLQHLDIIDVNNVWWRLVIKTKSHIEIKTIFISFKFPEKSLFRTSLQWKLLQTLIIILTTIVGYWCKNSTKAKLFCCCQQYNIKTLVDSYFLPISIIISEIYKKIVLGLFYGLIQVCVRQNV